MPNITRAMADTAGFIPQAWAQRALDILRTNMVLARFVTRDFDFEPGWKGKTLNIPYPGTFAAQDKAADTPVTVQTPTGGASVPVTLNKHKVVDFNIEDVARAQQSVELMDQYLRPAVVALGNQVEDDLFSLHSALTGTGVGTLGTDIVASTIRSARQSLNRSLAPMDGRALIVSDKDEVSILGDSNLATFFANARATAIAEGEIGNLYGFSTYMSQRVPIPTVEVKLGTQSSGTFTLSYLGETTSGIAFNATTGTVQTAVQGLSTVGSGNATVTGSAGDYLITFAAALAQNISPMTANFASLGTPANATIKNAYKNLAIHRDAMILAVRPFQPTPAGAGVDEFTAIDPETGLAVRVQRGYSMADRAVRYGVDILYGVKELRPTLGVIVAS